MFTCILWKQLFLFNLWLESFALKYFNTHLYFSGLKIPYKHHPSHFSSKHSPLFRVLNKIKSWANLKEFDYVIYRNQSFVQAGELYDGEQRSISS